MGNIFTLKTDFVHLVALIAYLIIALAMDSTDAYPAAGSTTSRRPINVMLANPCGGSNNDVVDHHVDNSLTNWANVLGNLIDLTKTTESNSRTDIDRYVSFNCILFYLYTFMLVCGRFS